MQPDNDLRCPTCSSPQPSMHPATSNDGEVITRCTDPFHENPTSPGRLGSSRRAQDDLVGRVAQAMRDANTQAAWAAAQRPASGGATLLWVPIEAYARAAVDEMTRPAEDAQTLVQALAELVCELRGDPAHEQMGEGAVVCGECLKIASAVHDQVAAELRQLERQLTQELLDHSQAAGELAAESLERSAWQDVAQKRLGDLLTARNESQRLDEHVQRLDERVLQLTKAWESATEELGLARMSRNEHRNRLEAITGTLRSAGWTVVVDHDPGAVVAALVRAFRQAEAVGVLSTIPASSPPPAAGPVNIEERSEDALQRFANELWRLSSGLADRGIPLRDGPVHGAAVDTALTELDSLRRYIESRDAGLSDHEAREDGWPTGEPDAELQRLADARKARCRCSVDPQIAAAEDGQA